MRKIISRWGRGVRGAVACAFLGLAGACDDEPRWTWAEWVQFDAGPLRLPEAGAADGGARDGAVASDGAVTSDGAAAADSAAVDAASEDAEDASSADDAQLSADGG